MGDFSVTATPAFLERLDELPLHPVCLAHLAQQTGHLFVASLRHTLGHDLPSVVPFLQVPVRAVEPPRFDIDLDGCTDFACTADHPLQIVQCLGECQCGTFKVFRFTLHDGHAVFLHVGIDADEVVAGRL